MWQLTTTFGEWSTAFWNAVTNSSSTNASDLPAPAMIEVRLLLPDVALLDGSWNGVRADQPVRGFCTATKQHGRWLIAAGRDRGIVVE